MLGFQPSSTIIGNRSVAQSSHVIRPKVRLFVRLGFGAVPTNPGTPVLGAGRGRRMVVDHESREKCGDQRTMGQGTLKLASSNPVDF
jgi:hypothetical protein